MPHVSEPFHTHAPLAVKLLHPLARAPVPGSDGAGGIDLFMPIKGELHPGEAPRVFGLGIAVAIPPGFVGLMLPRSGVGARFGLHLENTVGVIDSDYRGEWKASLSIRRAHEGAPLRWRPGERLLQLLICPVLLARFETLAENQDLEPTARADGRFGSTGR